MVLIQADEYGDGLPGESHAELFAVTMDALGLDPSYGAYVDVLPGTTLATVNLVSMFGLHRRLRGALVGHLAGFEMTSVGPMDRYGEGLRRLGLSRAARRFYDVHVEADVVHGMVASSRMAAGLARQEPDLAPDVLFGAGALSAVEARFTVHVLGSWESGRSSLRAPSRRSTSSGTCSRTSCPYVTSGWTIRLWRTSPATSTGSSPSSTTFLSWTARRPTCSPPTASRSTRRSSMFAPTRSTPSPTARSTAFSPGSARRDTSAWWWPTTTCDGTRWACAGWPSC